MSLTTIKRRIEDLERNGAPVMGYRVFTQSLTAPEVYLAENGDSTSLAQIQELSAHGWQCIVLSWQTDDPEAIHVNWEEGESESTPDWA